MRIGLLLPGTMCLQGKKNTSTRTKIKLCDYVMIFRDCLLLNMKSETDFSLLQIF